MSVNEVVQAADCCTQTVADDSLRRIFVLSLGGVLHTALGLRQRNCHGPMTLRTALVLAAPGRLRVTRYASV